MESQIAGVIYTLIALALITEMSINVNAKNSISKWRTKEKNKGFQKNICDITDRDSKVHCYCENTREPGNATKAECWVFNGGISVDDYIWQSFATQPNLQTLSFNVRVDGALEYIPTKALSYLHSLKSISLRYGNIFEILSFAFANLTDLREANLSQNQIEMLQNFSFAHLPNIKIINLEDNVIIDIDADAFVELPKLETLVLTKNNISMIKNGTFQHLFNLLELNLNKNNISYLNRRAFDGLANLKKLDLRKNRIQNLTEFTFAELWNLQELLMGKNDLRYIPERAFDGLSQLRKLSLDDNKLSSLPSKLFEGVRGLYSVDLRFNELHTLTSDNIKPIEDNLKLLNSNLLLEENNFVCDCRLKWMYSLQKETKSQNTKNSLDGATCKLDPGIMSSTYNKMPDALDNSNVLYNNKYIYTDLAVEILKDKMNFTGKKISEQDFTKEGSIEFNIEKTVLQIPPDKLPCPREAIKTTENPSYLVDSVIPIQNEIKTYRIYEMNSAYIRLVSSSLILWCVCFRYVLT